MADEPTIPPATDLQKVANQIIEPTPNQDPESTAASVPAEGAGRAQTEQLLSAKLALEGEEWTKKRQEREKESVLVEQQHKLNDRLQEITKLKTDLEIQWVDLDGKRRELKTILDPILKKEEEIEAKEFDIENTERNTGLPKEKEAIEKKRWLIEDERRAAEQEKWGHQEKLWKIEEAVETTTKQYRTLLDEEDKIHLELDKISKDMPVN